MSAEIPRELGSSDIQFKIKLEAELGDIEHKGLAHVEQTAQLIGGPLAEGVEQEHQKRHIMSFEKRRAMYARRRNQRNIRNLRPH